MYIKYIINILYIVIYVKWKTIPYNVLNSTKKSKWGSKRNNVLIWKNEEEEEEKKKRHNFAFNVLVKIKLNLLKLINNNYYKEKFNEKLLLKVLFSSKRWTIRT